MVIYCDLETKKSSSEDGIFMAKVFRNLSALKFMEDNNILENYGLLILNEEIKSSIQKTLASHDTEHRKKNLILAT